MSRLRLAAPLFALALLLTVAAPAAARWHPRPTTRPWQLQLSGKVDTSVHAPVYDVDGAETPSSTVRRLHRKGRRAICYFSAGSYEPYRSDSGSFPESVKGRPIEGFPDERWLDIRRIDLLAPIMRARLDMCRRKGYDAADPDNVDGFSNRSGFDLTRGDQLRYDRFIAREAHRRGLAVGLKNSTALVPQLARSFDFAVVEECFQYRECGRYSPFVRRGKPVYAVEYETRPRQFCATARRLRFSMLYKRLALGRFRKTCGRSRGSH